MQSRQVQSSQSGLNNFLAGCPERLTTIDSHTLGEPTRLLVDGVAPLPGTTIKAKCDYFARNHDHIRNILTREPRGHRDMVAAVVTEPVTPEARFGLFYMDARRYPYLCGHATIGAVTSLVETGAIAVDEDSTVISIDTPSGVLKAHTKLRNGRVTSVGIEMVPSFVLGTGYEVHTDSFGTVPVDLVFVGGFFAMISADAIEIEISARNAPYLISMGMAVIEAANHQLNVLHPDRPEVRTIDVAEFHSSDERDPTSGQSAVVYGEAHLDRSPCGTGTTAKMTLLHHQGKLAQNQLYKNRSPLGTVFDGEIIRTLSVGSYPAVVARIYGSACITGINQLVVDKRDPFPEGFLL